MTKQPTETEQAAAMQADAAVSAVLNALADKDPHYVLQHIMGGQAALVRAYIAAALRTPERIVLTVRTVFQAFLPTINHQATILIDQAQPKTNDTEPTA